jgi:hypothetical protein
MRPCLNYLASIMNHSHGNIRDWSAGLRTSSGTMTLRIGLPGVDSTALIPATYPAIGAATSTVSFAAVGDYMLQARVSDGI